MCKIVFSDWCGTDERIVKESMSFISTSRINTKDILLDFTYTLNGSNVDVYPYEILLVPGIIE